LLLFLPVGFGFCYNFLNSTFMLFTDYELCFVGVYLISMLFF
jgi:hypothetical protein